MSVPAETLPSFGDLTIWTSAGMTRKHSVVWFVCSPARYWDPAAGVYSTRKQYQPSRVGVNVSDVAVSLSMVSVPIASPPFEQSGFEVASRHTKNLAVPVTSPFVPSKVATSTTDSPLLMLETFCPFCWTWVSISGGTQVSRLPSAKSLSCASVSADERVSARNVPKHGGSPPNISLRLIPP